MNVPFTIDDLERAAAEWGANCGPIALAWALDRNIDSVRHAFYQFKGHTNPTQMAAALQRLGASWTSLRFPEKSDLFGYQHSLVRIQWTGPWTETAALANNPRWAYLHTHWIGTINPNAVFDCNGGIQSLSIWEHETVPEITGRIERADGGWYPTHVWRLAPYRQEAKT